jgi:hypothetical protein
MTDERPKQTPHAIASMRELMPMMVELLKTPGMQQQLRIQAKVLNWDYINDAERHCGLPVIPMPESEVFEHGGLVEKK